MRLRGGDDEFSMMHFASFHPDVTCVLQVIGGSSISAWSNEKQIGKKAT